MKDDRFAGLGVEALSEAQREGVAKLAVDAMARKWPAAPW